MSRFAPRTKPIVIAALLAFLMAGSVAVAQSTKAQPPPPKPRAAGKVTGVQLRPLKTSLRKVTCPAKFTFFGTITTDGPGDVEYTWVSSDGKSWPDQTVRFSGKGQQGVTTDWRVGEWKETVNAWIRLKVISPNEKLSTKTTFTVHCGDRVWHR